MDKQEIYNIKMGTDLLALAEKYTRLKRVARTDGGEYSGPCPVCHGEDRFNVWPNSEKGPHFWCRICGIQGDCFDLLQLVENLTFAQALDHCAGFANIPLDSSRKFPQGKSESKLKTALPPSEAWQQRGREFITYTQKHAGQAAAYLQRRGLDAVGVGFNPQDLHDDPARWGVEADSVFLPRGVVFPWFYRGQLWRIGIRRLNGSGSKMLGPKGYSATALYNADDLDFDKPAVLVEGEIDALSIRQVADDLVTAVATGGTYHARCSKWRVRLSLLPLVLVAFDSDEAGDKAARWWVDSLPNGKRWRPPFGDANDLLRAGQLQGWIEAGLESAGYGIDWKEIDRIFA